MSAHAYNVDDVGVPSSFSTSDRYRPFHFPTTSPLDPSYLTTQSSHPLVMPSATTYPLFEKEGAQPVVSSSAAASRSPVLGEDLLANRLSFPQSLP